MPLWKRSLRMWNFFSTCIHKPGRTWHDKISKAADCVFDENKYRKHLSVPHLKREVLRDLRQIMAAGLRLLQRHNKEILEELTLVQVLFSGAAGAAVVSLARLAQDGLDCSEALTMSFRRRRWATFHSRTVKMVAKKWLCVCLPFALSSTSLSESLFSSVTTNKKQVSQAQILHFKAWNKCVSSDHHHHLSPSSSQRNDISCVGVSCRSWLHRCCLSWVQPVKKQAECDQTSHHDSSP